MGDDHLDRETSVSAEITPTGLKASAKSRFVAAVDRLAGSLLDRMSAPLEAKSDEIRAQSESRVKVIAELTELGIQQLRGDSEYASAAAEAHLNSIIRRQKNKDAVVVAAIEDLRRQPPTEEQDSAGGEALDEGFLNRFERYAEDATSEQLRERWGRVLAAEIRAPGTFSSKVMRVVDELEPSTALLFEDFCRYRLGDCVPKCLRPNLNLSQTISLVSSGLLIDPGDLDQIIQFKEHKFLGDSSIWIVGIGRSYFGVKNIDGIKVSVSSLYPIVKTSDTVAVPIFILSDCGLAVASILPDLSIQAEEAYFEILSRFLPDREVCRLEMVESDRLRIKESRNI